jgi:hypothetical protein
MITADFLKGAVDPSLPESSLAKAVSLMPAALPELCRKHGISISAFREMNARYWMAMDGLRFTVAVVDQHGRRSESEYGGWSGQRLKSLDPLGRIRARPIRKSS